MIPEKKEICCLLPESSQCITSASHIEKTRLGLGVKISYKNRRLDAFSPPVHVRMLGSPPTQILITSLR